MLCWCCLQAMYVHATSAKTASIKECFEGKEVCSINLGKLVTLSDANNGIGKESKLAQVFPSPRKLLDWSCAGCGGVFTAVGCCCGVHNCGLPAETATADVVLRLRASPGEVSPSELRVAIIGNVDSGKSTMVSSCSLQHMYCTTSYSITSECSLALHH